MFSVLYRPQIAIIDSNFCSNVNGMFWNIRLSNLSMSYDDLRCSSACRLGRFPAKVMSHDLGQKGSNLWHWDFEFWVTSVSNFVGLRGTMM